MSQPNILPLFSKKIRDPKIYEGFYTLKVSLRRASIYNLQLISPTHKSNIENKQMNNRNQYNSVRRWIRPQASPFTEGSNSIQPFVSLQAEQSSEFEVQMMWP